MNRRTNNAKSDRMKNPFHARTHSFLQPIKTKNFRFLTPYTIIFFHLGCDTYFLLATKGSIFQLLTLSHLSPPKTR